jgi:hypothetical protein
MSQCTPIQEQQYDNKKFFKYEILIKVCEDLYT